jgi:hypothetical protein
LRARACLDRHDITHQYNTTRHSTTQHAKATPHAHHQHQTPIPPHSHAPAPLKPQNELRPRRPRRLHGLAIARRRRLLRRPLQPLLRLQRAVVRRDPLQLDHHCHCGYRRVCERLRRLLRRLLRRVLRGLCGLLGLVLSGGVLHVIGGLLLLGWRREGGGYPFGCEGNGWFLGSNCCFVRWWGMALCRSRDGSSWHNVFSGVQASLAARKSNEAASDCSFQQLSDGSNSGEACLLFRRNKVRNQHPRHLGI